MQAGQVKSGGEQVAPPQAPEDRPVQASEDSSQKDGRTGVISKVRTASDLVEGACGNAPNWQPYVDRFYAERDCSVTDARTLDSSDACSQIFKDSGLVHGIQRLANGLIRSSFVLACQWESIRSRRNAKPNWAWTPPGSWDFSL